MKTFFPSLRFQRFLLVLTFATASFAFAAPFALFAESPPDETPLESGRYWFQKEDGSVEWRFVSLENASPERRAEVRKRLASPEKATSEPFNDRFYKIFVPAPPAGKDASIAANAFNYPGEYNSLEMGAAWLPDGVRSIGAEAFYECYNLESVRLPNDLESIGDSAFFSCNLTTISFPNGLRSIGSDAFYHCEFATVALPDALETLAASAFSDCDELTAFSVGEKNRYFSAVDGVLFNKDQTELLQYPRNRQASEYVVPESVKKIGPNAFDGCRALTSITLPANLESIGKNAFNGCRALTSLTLPPNLKSIGLGAFDGCRALTTITIPVAVETLSDVQFFLCESLTSIEVEPENPSFRSIDGVLFNKDATELIRYPQGKRASEYVVPAGVEKIGSSAFEKCPWLKELTIPKSVKSIGGYAFSLCSSLRTATLPTGLETLADGLFSGCSSLTELTIPDGVKSIGAYAFSGCKSLETPTLPANLETIGSGAFSDCSSLTSLTLPNGVRSIGNLAFFGCSSLTTLTVPNGIETVGIWQFDDALQTITRSDGTQIPTADWVRETKERQARTKQ